MRSIGNCFEIAVTHINIFCVVYIVVRLHKASGGRVIPIASCKGVGQLTGGVCVTTEHIGNSQTALNAGLPRQKCRFDAVVICKPACIYDTTYVQNDHNVLKVFTHAAHKRFLLCGKIEITTVGICVAFIFFAGIAGDDDQGGVCKGGGFCYQCVRNGWLLRTNAVNQPFFCIDLSI